MARRTKLVIAALATALVATLGAASPATAGGPDSTSRVQMGTGGGWCC
jgi:hypothetical protein